MKNLFTRSFVNNATVQEPVKTVRQRSPENEDIRAAVAASVHAVKQRLKINENYPEKSNNRSQSASHFPSQSQAEQLEGENWSKIKQE